MSHSLASPRACLWPWRFPSARAKLLTTVTKTGTSSLRSSAPDARTFTSALPCSARCSTPYISAFPSPSLSPFRRFAPRSARGLVGEAWGPAEAAAARVLAGTHHDQGEGGEWRGQGAEAAEGDDRDEAEARGVEEGNSRAQGNEEAVRRGDTGQGEGGKHKGRKKKKSRREREEETAKANQGLEANGAEIRGKRVSYEEAAGWVRGGGGGGAGMAGSGGGGGKGAEANGAEANGAEANGARAEWPHVPVLVREVVGAFEGVTLRTWVDGTLGSGGHTLALAQHHPELQVAVGLDVDPSAHAIAAARLRPIMLVAAAHQPHIQDSGAARNAVIEGSTRLAEGDERAAEGCERAAEGSEGAHGFEVQRGQARASLHDWEEGEGQEGRTATLHLVASNFRRMMEACASVGVVPGAVDGILLDIGVSSMQIDRAERGFSFLRDGPLDMRMDPTSPLTAEVAVNDWPEEMLGQVLRDLGEERRWRQIARRIVQERGKGRITSTTQLAAIIAGGTFGAKKSAGASSSRRGGPGARIHPATRSFQALRIAVNDELAALALAIPAALSLLAPGGRLAIISFHSLEDRVVKRSFLDAAAGVHVSQLQAQWGGAYGSSLGLASGQGVVGVGSTEGATGGIFSGREGWTGPEERENGEGRPWVGDLGNAAAGIGGEQRRARYLIVTKRPVVAEEDEWRANSRSRSAKLRVIERVA